MGDRTSSFELLEEVRLAARAIEEAHRHLLEAVTRARQAGLSYAEIGNALGVSRQAAWERFHRVADRRPSN